MYTNEKIEIKIQRATASNTGLIPEDFRSLIEMEEPTRKSVAIKSLLAIRTNKPVVVSGKI